MSGREYVTREPQDDPELLSMEYSEAGFEMTNQLMLCAYNTCGAVAVYEAEYSDKSAAYWCRKHGEEEAEREGLEEAS